MSAEMGGASFDQGGMRLNIPNRPNPGMYTGGGPNGKQLVNPKCQNLPYISIGNPYVDPSKAMGKRSSYSGVQFQTKPPKKPAGLVGYFNNYPYMTDKFVDSTEYRFTQKAEDRQSAFGSKDASRRDEFSGTVRTEQYRENLKREAKHKAKISQEVLDAQGAAVPDVGYPANLTQPKNLYDVGRTAVTGYSQKTGRDTFYVLTEERPKRLGPYQLSSQSFGEGVAGLAARPKHARVCNTKAFYDKSHLNSCTERVDA